ncbi:PP2C family protein-serine/threonine phosphatase [Metamycoplasma buccale]|uniref:PP2C family protein-serine/threonine phosphatase n=1 Tax=Metamycoplasma buccale TaxID=55602 RepID=UPI00398F8A59
MDYCLKSDIGLVRPENQDRVSFISKEKWVLATLCDGMGGHYGGAKCATLTIQYFEEFFKNNFPTNVIFNDKKTINTWFIDTMAYIKENLSSFVKMEPTFEDMGTTLTAALIYLDEKEIYVFNVGDSRTYIYNGYLHQVTEDQNLKNELLRAGEINLRQAQKLYDGNKLTSCIGPKKVMNPEGIIYKKDSNPQYIILTSDGLHDFIEKPLFERVIQNMTTSIEEKATQLIDYAKLNGSNDNISVVIVEL